MTETAEIVVTSSGWYEVRTDRWSLELLSHVFFLTLCHVQDLTAQVSAETDPVALLAKVVSLLYIQVS